MQLVFDKDGDGNVNFVAMPDEKGNWGKVVKITGTQEILPAAPELGQPDDASLLILDLHFAPGGPSQASYNALKKNHSAPSSYSQDTIPSVRYHFHKQSQVYETLHALRTSQVDGNPILTLQEKEEHELVKACQKAGQMEELLAVKTNILPMGKIDGERTLYPRAAQTALRGRVKHLMHDVISRPRGAAGDDDKGPKR